MRVLIALLLLLPFPALAQTASTTDNADPRNESRTFSTFPEWYIVYSAEEYAQFVSRGGRPSEFPYFGAIDQYWETLDHVYANLGDTQIDDESKTVLNVIGVSFTLEYGVIGLYEHTIGRLTEALHGYTKTPIDTYTDQVAGEYAQFLYQTPWYKFPYFEKLRGLWKIGVHGGGIRGFERISAYSIGYELKGIYGALLGYLTRSAFGYVGMETAVTLAGGETYNLPRYRAFRDQTLALVRTGREFESIQGNSRILITLVAPKDTACLQELKPIFMMPILSQEPQARFGLLVAVPDLKETVQALDTCATPIEHIYDY